jgi:hypothetical protein
MRHSVCWSMLLPCCQATLLCSCLTRYAAAAALASLAMPRPPPPCPCTMTLSAGHQAILPGHALQGQCQLHTALQTENALLDQHGLHVGCTCALRSACALCCSRVYHWYHLLTYCVLGYITSPCACSHCHGLYRSVAHADMRHLTITLRVAAPSPPLAARQLASGKIFNSGGGSYLLNRAALDTLMNAMQLAACRPNAITFAEASMRCSSVRTADDACGHPTCRSARVRHCACVRAAPPEAIRAPPPLAPVHTKSCSACAHVFVFACCWRRIKISGHHGGGVPGGAGRLPS